jgi:hypothetical protein
MKNYQLRISLKLFAFILLSSSFIAGCKKDNQVAVDNVTFTNVQLASNQEVPTNTSSATATANVVYEKNSNTLTYTINFTGLTPTAMHFHKGTIGISGGVELEVKGPYTNGMTGTLKLTDAQETDLLAGLWYLNVHSASYAGGEIRGQIVSNNLIVISNVALNSKQEVPQNTSTATAVFNGLFDKTTKKITYSLNTNGFTPTVLHLHTGEVGVSGPVSIALAIAGGTTDALTTTQEADLLAGKIYVNMHSAAYAGGEIRGQITTQNQLVYALTANSANEVPTNASTATAAVYCVYSKDSKSLAYTINFTGVVPTSMHFHKGAIGVSGGVESAIAGPYTTGMKGVATLTATQEVDLFTNLWYFNLHSATFTGGEIRGQLVR